MNPLLEQFLSEARDVLQAIGEKLMQLEETPDDIELMTELFRLVHTLKGNSGLFEFPEMTRVLHAGEDLMDAVRNGGVAFSKDLADRLLDAMDFVGLLCDELDTGKPGGSLHAADSARLVDSLRQLIDAGAGKGLKDAIGATPDSITTPAPTEAGPKPPTITLASVPEAILMEAFRHARDGEDLSWLRYIPPLESFFQGDDPFFQARRTPDLLWGLASAREPWPSLATLDAYQCRLEFQLLSTAPRAELDEYFRYMPDQVVITTIAPADLVVPEGRKDQPADLKGSIVDALGCIEDGDVESASPLIASVLERSQPNQWISSALRWMQLLVDLDPTDRLKARQHLLESLRVYESGPEGAETAAGLEVPTDAQAPSGTTGMGLSAPERQVVTEIMAVQHQILSLPVTSKSQIGRMKAVIATLSGCMRAQGNLRALASLDAAAGLALSAGATTPLLDWIDEATAKVASDAVERSQAVAPGTHTPLHADTHVPELTSALASLSTPTPNSSPILAGLPPAETVKFGRRSEEPGAAPKSLKVDQSKIDRLMNLIGEMVVSKNALPYLAGRAETVFGVRELSREIKAQYAVINRIAEEMQDAIMQIRMMPVSSIFQRFPRLVRDTSRKLGKEVQLVLLGEETEADKNIIESLGDPLVHIIRNSLDHGFELPEVRRLAGKPVCGTLTIRASQDSDRVVIEITDDGKGIDPVVIKQRAYEKGLIDEGALERLTDQEAVNLVFAPGFSTTEVVSDLSGRGVGMDVVRSAVERVNGTVLLESEKNKGTRLRLSLPLSMAVTNVMLFESAGQLFGIPLEYVVETVRIRRSDVRTIKSSQATVLRGRVVPLKSINLLLGLGRPAETNADDELAVLVVRLGNESIGLLVDAFHETVDIILKPMSGVLAGISTYSGSALLGDGSVLMVLNVKGLL